MLPQLYEFRNWLIDNTTGIVIAQLGGFEGLYDVSQLWLQERVGR